MIPVKPGIASTELWLIVVVAVLILVGLADEHALELAILGSGYALSRGVAKISPTADWTEDPHTATPDDLDVSPEERHG